MVQGGHHMLSNNIKNYRKQKGYTQETLAQALNIVRQTVSKWEKGYSVPDAEMLEKLAEVLEVSVSDLLGKQSESIDQSSEIEKLSSQLAILNDQIAREIARKKKSRKIKAIVILSVLLSLILIGSLVLFVAHPIDSLLPGDTSHVEIRNNPSNMYSENDIDCAIEIIKSEFENWNGCTLTLLYYAGDDISTQEAEKRGAPTIVLLSEFATGNLDGNDGLNSNETYRNWSWILIKDENGQWKHIDHGYG